MALTIKRVEKLKTPGRYRDERGLYLEVRSETNRSWLLRYEKAGRERWMGLGPVADVPLDTAREEARKAHLMLRDGIDPIDARAQQRKAQDAKSVTFETAAMECFKFHEPKWRNAKHRAQFLSTLEQYAFPHFGKVTVGLVDKTLVLKALNPIWKVVPETASRVRQRIEKVLNFATGAGYRDGENPARWKGHLDQVLLARTQIAKVVPHSAMDFADVPEFLKALRQRLGPSARALEFTILTAARTGETIGAVWDEFDLQAGIWTIPEERMKAKRPHRVPLTKAVLDILRPLEKVRKKTNPYVFVGLNTPSLSGMAMTQLLRRMKRGNVTTHGFRASFSTWASERTNFAPEVTEAALAHITGDATERAYRRGDVLDKRRRLMEAWAGFCAKPAGEGGTVHQIRRAG